MLESQITTNDKLPNIHPGEILKEEFLVPMNISAYRLAKEGQSGCKTVFDIAPAYLSPLSGDEIRAHLL